MRRVQLEHAIRTACQIIGHPAVIIVGSQAILGSFGEDELQVEATMSVEVDVLPIADSNTVIAELADLIEGVAGEWSPFEEMHGFSIDGVDLDTAVLPTGWRDRLVPVQNANTAAPSGRPQFIGWCLDPEDLCVAKLCAHREKDLNFVRALHAAGVGGRHRDGAAPGSSGRSAPVGRGSRAALAGFPPCPGRYHRLRDAGRLPVRARRPTVGAGHRSARRFRPRVSRPTAVSAADA